MAALGRPPTEFTPQQIKQIEMLARAHCPDHEISAFLSIGETTLKRHFGPSLKEWRAAGAASLRMKQFQLAMSGDKTMLVWIGKQVLGQSEPQRITVQSTSTTEVKIDEATKLIVEDYLRLLKDCSDWDF